MRTYVRVPAGHDPARRRRRVLRLGGAARRSSPARPPHHRRLGGGDGGQLRGQGVRGAWGDGRSASPSAVSEGGGGRTPLLCLRRGEQGGVRGLRADGAPGRGAVDGGGLPRRAGAGEDLRISQGDRLAPAARRPRAGRPADHRGGGEDEGPGEDGQPLGQARRAARGSARARVRLPRAASGGTALGRGTGYRQEAPRPGDRDRRPARPAARGGPGLDRRPGGGPPSAGDRSQPRSPPGAAGDAVGARSVRSPRSEARRDRRRPSTPWSSVWSIASPAGCGHRGESAAP
jgi:hypothetical protein